MAGRWTFILLVLIALNVLGTLAGGGKGKDGRGGWPPRHYGGGRWDDDDNGDDYNSGSSGSSSGSSSSDEDCDYYDSDEFHPHRGSGEKHHGGPHHGNHHKDRHHHRWHWTKGAGVAVLIVIVLVICGLVSIVTWLSCKVYSKCRARKVAGLKGTVAGPSSSPPEWARNLVYQPELSVGFGLVSDGLARVGPAHLIRKRQGTRETDGATWAVPMTKGKHVFEITWPWAHRGSHASVGVGTTEAPLKGKGSNPLVGGNDHTWGLDIVARKARHANRPVMNCPTDGSFVPDKFLMYVNVDDGILGFGNEVTYWGDIIQGLPKQGKKPLHVMVATSRWQAELSVLYMGSAPDGDNDLVKQNPPHHLPPLAFRVPPSYTELEEAGPIMVKPATPEGNPEQAPPMEKPMTPPPAYRQQHLPVGYNPLSIPGSGATPIECRGGADII